jgi:peptide/nickel transport system substrate-binding protein
MNKLHLILIIIVLSIVLILGGCTMTPALPSTTTQSAASASATKSPAASLTPRYGGTLRILRSAPSPNIGLPAEPGANMNTDLLVSYYESLLRSDNQGNISPWLAESYKLADDNKSITFSLRKGVKFHDGSGFNAEVAKWNLDNYINARMEPYWTSVDILDDYTIRVNFNEWSNTLPSSFGDSDNAAFMISKAACDKNGKDWIKTNPVGTGPFKFVSIQQDVGLKVEKNPDYWIKGRPYLDGIDYLFVVDPNTVRIMMQTGEGDMTQILGGKWVADYKTMGLRVETLMDDVYGLIGDTADADSPWANQKVREAVEYAIDREAIAKGFGFGYRVTPYQIPARDSLAYDPTFSLGRHYDPNKAKQLLAEAGYPDGFKTTIIAPVFDDRDILVTVQDYLAKVGIQANLDYAEMGKWVTYTGPGKWPDNSALSMVVPRFDVSFMGGIKFISNMFGQSWLRTPEFTQAYQTALAAPTTDIKLIRAVTDIMTKNALYIPVNEGGGGRVTQLYVIAGYNERGLSTFWNTEEAWLNK